MRFRSLVLILAALLMAGGTAYLTRGWIQAQRAAMLAAAPVAQKPKPAIQVLVAKDDLPVGRFVRPENLRWQAWPEGTLAPSYIVEGTRKLEDFVGAVVRLPLAAGEPISEGRLVTPGNSGFLAAVLGPGMRAVSVPVNVTSGISGFVFPGDRVDLILVHVVAQDAGSNVMERRASETVLRNIRVLAIDQKIETKPGETLVARTATLEVTPKQSEMIAVIGEMGKLSLSLRSLAQLDDGTASLPEADGAAGKSRGTDISYTLDSDVSRLLAPPKFGSAEHGESSVTVLRGNKASELKLTVDKAEKK